MEQNKVLVFENDSNERLDKILSSKFPNKSRSYWQKMIQQGYILVDDQPVIKTNEKVAEGSVVVIRQREEQPLDIIAQDIPIDIVFQDDTLAVINKERGMVVHPSHGHDSGTLVNALLFHLKDLSSINGIVRPGIVHRIDKDTSGLLIIAKNDASHTYLSDQLKDKTLYREYIALVHGEVKDDAFIIDLPIGRHPQKRKSMAIIEDGKEARTHIEVIERFKDYTLLRCRLETGRTHQIRVHLQYIGYPIVGDPLYTQKKDIFNLNGQFLHAYKLGFIHPQTHKKMKFEIAMPEVLTDILKQLEKMEKAY